MKTLAEILADTTISKADKEIALEGFAPLGYGARNLPDSVNNRYKELNHSAHELAEKSKIERNSHK